MDNWVEKIREKIGHDPIILPHAVTIVLDLDRRLLVEERADDGYLDFPGGTLDIGETIEDCAKRELKEETGLIVDIMMPFKTYTGDITKYEYANGDVIYGIDVVYLVSNYHGDMAPQKEEVKSLKFMRLGDIQGKLSPRNKQILKDLKKFL